MLTISPVPASQRGLGRSLVGALALLVKNFLPHPDVWWSLPDRREQRASHPVFKGGAPVPEGSCRKVQAAPRAQSW